MTLFKGTKGGVTEPPTMAGALQQRRWGWGHGHRQQGRLPSGNAAGSLILLWLASALEIRGMLEPQPLGTIENKQNVDALALQASEVRRGVSITSLQASLDSHTGQQH